MTSANEESPHITQLPELQQLSPPQLYWLRCRVITKACPDAFVVSLPTDSPEVQLIRPIRRPRAHRPKRFRFHFSKVEINNAFRKYSSE
ncbi:hypothetical protein CDAR_529101 [Caerostris darwini]|uniref:Uncharacterized protein n=1 Tax=Caerostris darwini TaxID=1538125 RepID=A0AAV4UD67_9ARAC|nr:hypothetical protein CDAR_529101 [Caerostris darwini]